eukprot:scaffold16906_cov113-Cylindrotheca_fusiformis.AAC.3
MAIKGVIRPPPDIRVVADRTASYVAKNGRAFEARILNSEKGKTPKFAFLQPTSPFHAYYEDRIEFYEKGGEDDEERSDEIQPETKAKPKPDTKRKQEKKQKASAVDPIARSLLSQRNRITQAKAKENEASNSVADDSAKNLAAMASLIPPPPLDLVSVIAPTGLSASQIETVQLVAIFTALDGKGGSFLHQLTVREWNNSEFSFCQPRHAHFAYFSALVDAYRQVLAVWAVQDSVNTPVNGSTSIEEILDEAAYRAEYEREVEKQNLNQEEGEIIVIDWHDFVVVETIDFPAGEAVELSMLPPPPPPPPSNTTSQVVAPSSTNVGHDDGEDEDETIRVVPSYTPKVVGPARPQETRAIDPITGKSVSITDVPEHLRIQLLDPKYAEEKRKFQAKQKDSNLVGDDAIATNISRLARDRDLPSNARDPKRRLEETNPTARDALYQQNAQTSRFAPATAGPNPVAGEGSGEPVAKRLRMEKSLVPPPPSHATDESYNNEAAIPDRHDGVAGLANSNQPGDHSSNNEADSSEIKMMSETEFAASLAKPEVTLQIRIPNDPSQMAWNFYGQIISMTANVMSKVKDVKAELSRTHLNGMPSNKIQFKDGTIGFLKDSMTLASLNIGPTATIEMKSKTRGGRK